MSDIATSPTGYREARRSGHRRGVVDALCADDATLNPQAAFGQLIEDRPRRAGFGAVLHLLRGTPIT
jgi:hypothetical protein